MGTRLVRVVVGQSAPPSSLENLNLTLSTTLTDLDPYPNAERNANSNPNPSHSPNQKNYNGGQACPQQGHPPYPHSLFLSNMHKSSLSISTCAEIRTLGEHFRGEPFRPATC